jgi:NAD(P)-dependent dehydrogenase (short-subunit alcohol dehydrogenase family)
MMAVLQADLSGKVAVVTGATSGMGAEIARTFASSGAAVVVVGRNAQRGGEVVAEIEAQGGQATFCSADVSKTQDIEALFEFIEKEYGTLDIVVNNAGILVQEPLEELSAEAIDLSFATNTRSSMLITNLALPYLKKTNGNVVFVASMIAIRPTGQSYAYGASKAAVLNFMQLSARNYAKDHVRFNAILPGIIETPIIPEAARDTAASLVPWGRLGTVQEIANTALFLASPAASFITGQWLAVDGGHTA